MMNWYKSLTLTLLVAFSASAQDYQTTVVADNLEFPWSLAQLPDGRLLVTERPGRLRLIDTERNGDMVTVRGLPDNIWTGEQGGLFEIKIAPDFASSGNVFISYACGTAEANTVCLSRAELRDQRLHNLEEIFRASPTREGSAHFGSRFIFLPDGTLLLGLGDGFDYREQAQKPENHLGSIVRINQDGSVPADNPFVGDDRAAAETYSYGHRNVQGLARDPQSGNLYATEHGPQGGDELNLIEPSANYGWPLVTEGVDYTGARVAPFKELPGMVPPLHTWTPSVAPSSLWRYQGDEFSDWNGDYFVSTLAAKDVRRLQISDGRVEEERLFTELDTRIRLVTQTTDGTFYLLTDDKNGQLIRVTAN